MNIEFYLALSSGSNCHDLGRHPCWSIKQNNLVPWTRNIHLYSHILPPDPVHKK